eukprot:6751998-Alexandrium_andersonii.AAC.1
MLVWPPEESAHAKSIEEKKPAQEDERVSSMPNRNLCARFWTETDHRRVAAEVARLGRVVQHSREV